MKYQKQGKVYKIKDKRKKLEIEKRCSKFGSKFQVAKVHAVNVYRK